MAGAGPGSLRVLLDEMFDALDEWVDLSFEERRLVRRMALRRAVMIGIVVSCTVGWLVWRAAESGVLGMVGGD